MDEEYDVIVLGTGFTECILSGLLSVDQKKVLHMDKNAYYGGESASLQLDQLYDKLKGEGAAKKELGSNRDYNVDLIPKFIMACGQLVKILLHTRVTRYLDFKNVMASYVFISGKVYKVPATDGEALKSSIMGFFQKRKAKNFFLYCQNYDEANPATHDGKDLTKVTCAELFYHYGLDANTVDFIGHSLALYREDSYLQQPALALVTRIRLYVESMMRYGRSPYIYPLYGLGELPQAFARLSAIYGGTYMLNKPFEGFVFDDAGKVCGVKSEGQVAKCKQVICDPSYALADERLSGSVRKAGQVIRCICVLSHPIANVEGESVQIVIPQKQVGRKHDIYISCLDSSFNVCAPGKFVALVSTTVETQGPPEQEIRPALALLGRIDEHFLKVYDLYEPTDSGVETGVFVSRSYDATSHFETAVDDVLDLYTRATGAPLEIKIPEDDEQ